MFSHGRLNSTLQCSSQRNAQCGHWSWKPHYLFIMRDFAYSWITEQHILVRGSLSRETQTTPKPCFSPYFLLSCSMGIRPRSVHDLAYVIWGESFHILDKLHWCQGNILSCGYCVNFDTVVFRRYESLLDEFCEQDMKYPNFVWIHIRKAKRTPNSTASVFSVFLVFFLPGIYGEQNATL